MLVATVIYVNSSPGYVPAVGSLHQYVQQAEWLSIVKFFLRRGVNFSRLVYDKESATDPDAGQMSVQDPCKLTFSK